MIEIVCNGESGKNEKNGRETPIRVPKNIKQIGDVSSERKIYIEDYAFSYINSLAYGNDEEEQAGVLLGECQKSENEKCMFIKGVIKAKSDEEKDRQEICFNERVWDKVYSEVEKYFPNLQVVGWFAATENITPEKMRRFKKIHMDNFSGGMKTMYLINKLEKEENFYLYENGDLRKQSGYVCFYERNYEMQEYMMEKRGPKMVESPCKDNVMKNIRSIIQEKEELKQQKKNARYMYGLSTFMAVVVLVIGINLMNSYEKMENFDKSLNNIAMEISSINKGEVKNKAENEANVVPVNRLSGDVYPTEAETQQESAGQLQSEEEENSEEYTATASSDDMEPVVIATEAAAVHETYVVKQGDTVLSICKSVYGNVSKYHEIVTLNNMEDANKLYIGQEIKLP